ncbi:MAG: helicase C-terminal domain-containing protein [Verrucomicrobiota bacterium]
MKIDPETRIVQIGIRELAEFEVLRAGRGGTSGTWRLETGRAWHKTVQEEHSDEFLHEHPVQGKIVRGGWQLFLDGRCDLFHEEATTAVFGEIKTVTDALPLSESELRTRYPSYFRQLATYLLASNRIDSPEKSFLLFLNIDSAIRQTVPLQKNDLADLEKHIERLLGFFEFSANRATKRKNLTWPSFQDHSREGQVEASREVSAAEEQHRIVGFQAPTGFGKTRIILEHALEAIKVGKADRIIYLTGKTSGQEQACVEAATLFPSGNDFRTYRMRNHREHYNALPCEDCLPDQCGSPHEGQPTPPLDELIALPGNSEKTWENIIRLADAYRMCPYTLSRAILTFTDLWIGDYNYLFSPSSRHVFLEQPGFDPARTWLLIDEAHNLPNRVASSLGGSLVDRSVGHAADELSAARGGKPLSSVLRELTHEFASLRPDSALGATESYLFANLFEAGAESLSQLSVDWRELTPDTVSTLQALGSAHALLENEALRPILWSPSQGRIDWLPLKVGPWITKTLEDFAQTVFFSGTLDPFSIFLEDCGMESRSGTYVRVSAQGPNQFRTAIDGRVRTTLRERGNYAPKTAETIRDLAERATSCVAAFFPSFEYAETIATYLGAIAPHLRSEVQPRNLNVEERENFARTAPLSNDVLFLMLGGSFSEAVDSLGGIIETAIIVGPALPELSTINRIRIDEYPDKEQGFHHVCRIPGMRRVNQAIGRLVRSQEHRATIVLHDSRFLEKEYRDLLRDDLGEITEIRNDADWPKWALPR